ncbi:hypothetical protein [Methylobacterium frigidaeris]|uniref:Uncharacterized protein n=1 Tax=Methylobacterium frigidaeris TaxID=2038277 RepID=A0AA37HDY3_9HYPH|nr:hypothetical protein [Methylobacterium frigidaeris]PIK72860.1 hypothetical protein CS379_11640 [Methylobacterium frigidaeris]GJD64004.1 hypothetical protein MPEAHAMD_4178 [Methylobacterium frigidaeris]
MRPVHPTLRTARRSRRAVVLAVLASAAGVSGGRAEENECQCAPVLSAGPVLALERVSAPGRTAFVKDGLARAGCPDSGTACRERAYLVTRDAVILGERRGASLCATYRSAKDDDVGRTGWIPAEAVAVEPAAPVAIEGWLGTWKQAEAQIRVTRGDKADALAVAGYATWGASDPDRVRRGGIHIGEISGTVVPVGDAVSFAMGENGTLPVQKGGDSDCKVWLRRLGPWLLVDDNLACGGMNVTVRCVYWRTP